MGDKNDPPKDNLPVKDFLSRHVPDQVTNSRKLCYRHRPDLIKRRQPDSLDIENAQRVKKKSC
jgi:F-box/WD-40 domain protein MET30